MERLTLDHLGLGPRSGARRDVAPAPPGVLYAEDFDEPESPPRPSPPPAEPPAVEPSYTAAELEAARAAAADDAARLAREQARSEDTHACAQALCRLAGAVAEAKADARRVAEEAVEALARTVLSLLTGALPDLCARHAEGEVRAVVRALLPALQAEPRVTVRLHPRVLPGVRAELAGSDAELSADIALLPTDTLAPGDLRVTWTEGALVRDTGATHRAMQDVLAGLGLLDPAPDSPPAPAPALDPSTKEHARVQ